MYCPNSHQLVYTGEPDKTQVQRFDDDSAEGRPLSHVGNAAKTGAKAKKRPKSKAPLKVFKPRPSQ